MTTPSPAEQNKLTKLLEIRYPIIQAGMVWCSGWRLAAACSNAGILGTIGAGSMYPDTLEEHLIKMKAATTAPFAVNLPLLYPDIQAHVELIAKYKVPVVITSAGNPKTYTAQLKEAGTKVLHVVSSAKFAEKAASAGVDGIICEGFEAGGHNGRDETTTLCLVPQVRRVTDLPLAAAGGIGSGQAMLAMMALGADGVQVGSRFVASEESSAHPAFKEAVVKAREGDTVLTLKEVTPVRLLKNGFYNAVAAAYSRGDTVQMLKALLGKGRAKAGMFEGNLDEGELEIGQVSAQIDAVQPAAEIIQTFIASYNDALDKLRKLG